MEECRSSLQRSENSIQMALGGLLRLLILARCLVPVLGTYFFLFFLHNDDMKAEVNHLMPPEFCNVE